MTDLSAPMTLEAPADNAAAQRTDEWRKARSGKWTGSTMMDIVARNKKTGEKLASFDARVWKVVTERLTGQPEEGVSSFSLQWGTDLEPYALERYEIETGNVVTQTGFVQHPKYSFVGASADGLIGLDGCLEAKCPKNSSIHLERFLSGVPEDYRAQIQTEIWVCERDWCDFVSFDPRQTEKFQMLRIRVNRDDQFIKRIEESVLMAEEAACSLIERLEKVVR